MKSQPRKPRLEYYQDTVGLWRWRFVASNGRILADSGQGYHEQRKAELGWLVMRDSIIGSTHRVEVVKP